MAPYLPSMEYCSVDTCDRKSNFSGYCKAHYRRKQRTGKLDEKRLISVRHGMSSTRTHKSWRGLKERCLNPKHHRFKNYGGRGIKVCDRWISFQNFLYDMGECPSNKHSIDRIKNNEGYSKSNCRWATADQQAQNTTRTKISIKQIRQLRLLYESGNWTQISLAKKFKISQPHVSSIILKKVWV
jgi:hypothetical protein